MGEKDGGVFCLHSRTREMRRILAGCHICNAARVDEGRCPKGPLFGQLATNEMKKIGQNSIHIKLSPTYIHAGCTAHDDGRQSGLTGTCTGNANTGPTEALRFVKRSSVVPTQRATYGRAHVWARGFSCELEGRNAFIAFTLLS